MLFVTSLVSDVVLIRQTSVATISAEAAKDSVQMTRDQFHLENRAYLAVGETEEVLGSFMVIKIPLINTGHVPTKGEHLTLNYRRGYAPGAPLEEKVYKYDTAAPIPPGTGAYFLTVGMPQIPTKDASEVTRGEQFLFLHGKMQYDSGFGGTDTLYMCYDFNGKRGHWRNCSGQSMNIWLNDVQPEESRKPKP